MSAGASRNPAAAPRRRIAGATWARAATALLLAAHLALGIWGIAENSVTFDENAHVASGLAMVTRGNPWISAVNPPLVKAAFGAAALAAGARLPAGPALEGRDQFAAGEAVMRANADRYHRVFSAARAVTLALSILLAVLVGWMARRLYGHAAGLLALALFALNPESLAHGGLATLDLATALGALATLLAFLRFARSGSWRAWAVLAAAFGAIALVRYSAWLVWVLLAALAVAAIARRFTPSRARVAAGVLALVPVAWVALQIGYLGQTSYRPLAAHRFASARFQQLQRQAPRLVLPVPDAYLLGFDHQVYESQTGITATYLLGRVLREPAPQYTPIAMAVKWPLALWAALGVAAILALRRRGRSDDEPGDAARRFEEAALACLALAFVASTMLIGLNVGVRYLLPALAPAAILASRWLRPDASGRTPRRAGAAAIVLAGFLAFETAGTAPHYLSFFNAAGGGPGGGDRIVNDSNADVGHGLIALRRELERLGVRRVHLAYHGTVDPALYGIDYVPYFGGEPGRESDWIAISSYYFVGLSQRMMTREGRTEFVEFRFQSLWNRPPAARPAHCMYVYRLR